MHPPHSSYRITNTLDATQHELFAWHARPGAFERLVPPWETSRLVRKQGTITDGSVLIFQIKNGPLWMTWEAHHDQYVHGEQFRDVQHRGPFAAWEHTHRFEPSGEDRSVLDDSIQYRLPLHRLTAPLADWFVQRMLDRMFTFRHERTMNDLRRHKHYENRPKLRVAITGASGLVGSALSSFLSTGGHTVYPVSRRPSDAENAIQWDPLAGIDDASQFEGLDAVVHLAGETINQRWSEPAKDKIVRSRVEGTERLSAALASLKQKPRVFISASAIGYYGDRADEELTEESKPGGGFLAGVCEGWEAATSPARDAGIRVVNARLSLVLTAKGGALGQMLTPFKMGMGGNLGSGKQYMSWMSIDDIVGAILHVIHTPELSGPVNFSTPNPIPNKVFTKTLGKVLGRPTVLPAPRFGIALIFGSEAADEMLLASQRVLPNKLEASGFEFYYPDLEPAIRFAIGQP